MTSQTEVDTSTVKVKGSALAGRRQYVIRHHGEKALQAVLDKLHDREMAKRLQVGIVKSAWYPFELFVDLTKTIDKVIGKGDGALYRVVAAQTAEDDLSTVYKIFFKFLEPLYIVQKSAMLWNSYYSSGRLEMATPNPTTIQIEIIGFATPDWAHCESVLGWTQRSIQLTGVKDVRVEHMQCRGKGDQHCRMQVSWKE